MRALFLAASLGLYSTSYAAAQNATLCASLMTAYEEESKSASLSWAEAAGDNSATRATLKQLEINNHLLAKQMNLTLMIQHKCPMPQQPVGVLEYPLPAMKCSTAMLSPRTSDAPLPDCDTSKWSRPVARKKG